jgi:hypothetical protein
VSWDHLGLVCLISLTICGSALVPVTFLAKLGASPLALLLSLAVTAAVIAPLSSGACWLANTSIERDEPSYGDLWKGAARLFGRAVMLSLTQALVTAALCANIVFYLSRASFAMLLLAILFGYLLAFWTLQLFYHYPLLVAMERGLLRREGERTGSLLTLLRNAMVIALSSPGYTVALLALLFVVLLPSVLLGAGIALVLPGFAAFLAMQATRDQLVRFGHLEPPPDPDEPLSDERWRLEPESSSEANKKEALPGLLENESD